MIRLLLLGSLVFAAILGLFKLGEWGYGPIVITREGEQKLKLFLGDPRDEPTVPGWSLRWPIFDDVRSFDARWLHLSIDPGEIQTIDRERIVVDNYVIWRIADPLLYYKSFPAGGAQAETRIEEQVRAIVREVIGQHTLTQVVQTARVDIMDAITTSSREALQRFGIAVNDVRINHTELPAGTETNVYARMRAERERLARKHRAEGDEEARTIRARAEATARVLVAEARREAEVERGQGDAEALRIYAEAYSTDADFYAFLRGLEAYRKTVGEGTTLVLPPSHEFFKLFQTGGSLDRERRR